MIWETFLYYVGFVTAICLYWGLGRIFVIPMILDLAFDTLMILGLFSRMDARWVVLAYGFGFFLWVLALSGALSKKAVVALLSLDLVVITQGLWEPLQASGAGRDFWNVMSEQITNVWLMSILVVVGSVIVRSTVVGWHSGQRADLLSNPKKRFLIPIGAWAAVILVPFYFRAFLSDSFLLERYRIAALALVWGWVALELPFYLIHKRLMREFR